MINLIGGKYRVNDFSFTRKDMNIFFSDLRNQNEDIAGWSEKTVVKLKQVLAKCLTETGMLGSVRDTALRPVLISEELEAGIRKNGDIAALAAFNCFRGENDYGGN